MSEEKCNICHKEKELVCCKECMQKLIMQRIAESINGDVANRIKWIIIDLLDEYEERIKNLLKDKQIVINKQGRKRHSNNLL